MSMDSQNIGSSMCKALHLDIDIEDEEQYFPDYQLSMDANATPSRSISNSLNAGTSKSRHKSSQK
jgi:hypothetical protein